jgi:hypothetical protein
VDTINGTSEFESGDYVSTVTRVMVSQNRLWSDSEEVVALQVFSEVIEMEGKKVKLLDGEKDNKIIVLGYLSQLKDHIFTMVGGTMMVNL